MARVPQQADAEDIVQNTFASFVKVVGTLQIRVSLETYLFGIVRNEIVQRIRTQRAKSVCLIQDVYYKDGDDMSSDALAQVRSPDPSTSWCVSHDEEHRSIREALTEAVRSFVKSLHKKKKLHRLKMAELLAMVSPDSFIARVSIHDVKHIKQTRRAIQKAFEIQIKGEGFGLVEILSTCPTNWKMDASACMEKIKSEIIPSFPLGIFTDKLKENA